MIFLAGFSVSISAKVCVNDKLKFKWKGTDMMNIIIATYGLAGLTDACGDRSSVHNEGKTAV